jgi:type II secretion system protein G
VADLDYADTGSRNFETRQYHCDRQKHARSSGRAGDQDTAATLRKYEGFFPSTEQGLGALVAQPQSDPGPTRWYQLFKELPKDPWGSDYIYRNPGLKNPGGYDLYSAGPDRQADTSDDDYGGG